VVRPRLRRAGADPLVCAGAAACRRRAIDSSRAVGIRPRVRSRGPGAADLMTDTVPQSLHPADNGRMQQGFSAFPEVDRWSDYVEGGRHFHLLATTCFNCEAA